MLGNILDYIEEDVDEGVDVDLALEAGVRTPVPREAPTVQLGAIQEGSLAKICTQNFAASPQFPFELCQNF